MIIKSLPHNTGKTPVGCIHFSTEAYRFARGHKLSPFLSSLNLPRLGINLALNLATVSTPESRKKNVELDGGLLEEEGEKKSEGINLSRLVLVMRNQTLAVRSYH